MGHKTSHCVLFKDLVQRAFNEGRLKFADKAKSPMHMDFDSLQIKYENYVEPLECLIIEATESTDVAMEVSESEYAEKVKEVYPTTEEEHVDFLNRCKLKRSEVMLCLRCSFGFDRKAIEGLEKTKPQPFKEGKWPQSRPNYAFNKRGVPYRTQDVATGYNEGRHNTYV